MSTVLGLPVRVHDGQLISTDHTSIPHPDLGVDRLTDRAQETKAG
jgi:hypothetical protein